ncbi:MAG TPA: pyridoxal phosphate-dependent aminotransferase [Candidatus Pseudogracilibacillus intestinigallinarum]|uniref:cysteine-S-conjugate beta-lyase n=1 Tax=Candidatus Pseudogracilibacillus intestinigallinarum TaxID=2838742 RepID=A0A9D1TIY5_9BACI|nr:pyridoxal phosphate-dependent aminotransferase [Candidatus Pseudogracilibacillus intestinigallinarum]
MSQFQTVHNREQTRSMKWDNRKAIFNSEEVLPMWVADMDFKAPEAVNNALKERAQHGIYGYTVITEDIRNNVTNWISLKHGWDVETNWLSFSPGVITSLHIAIQTFTNEGDNILIQTPVYTPFFNLIKNGNRQVVENALKYDGKTYTIDFDDLEEKLKTVKAFILCSPHNPVGRVWTKEELTKIAALCEQHDVLVFSDEIHADLVFDGYKHIPFASISEEARERTITCMSPTKTFNLAGLQASYIVTKNNQMRAKINAELGLQGFNMLNTMGVIALDAAYANGKPWLDQLMKVIEANKLYATTRIENETNGKLKVIASEATYLLWVDCHELGLTDKELQAFMIEQAKVGLNAGSSYGTEGENFMRINIACPKATLQEGLDRIIHAVNALA